MAGKANMSLQDALSIIKEYIRKNDNGDGVKIQAPTYKELLGFASNPFSKKVHYSLMIDSNFIGRVHFGKKVIKIDSVSKGKLPFYFKYVEDGYKNNNEPPKDASTVRWLSVEDYNVMLNKLKANGIKESLLWNIPIFCDFLLSSLKQENQDKWFTFSINFLRISLYYPSDMLRSFLKIMESSEILVSHAFQGHIIYKFIPNGKTRLDVLDEIQNRGIAAVGNSDKIIRIMSSNVVTTFAKKLAGPARGYINAKIGFDDSEESADNDSENNSIGTGTKEPIEQPNIIEDTQENKIAAVTPNDVLEGFKTADISSAVQKDKIIINGNEMPLLELLPIISSMNAALFSAFINYENTKNKQANAFKVLSEQYSKVKAENEKLRSSNTDIKVRHKTLTATLEHSLEKATSVFINILMRELVAFGDNHLNLKSEIVLMQGKLISAASDISRIVSNDLIAKQSEAVTAANNPKSAQTIQIQQ
jgi:hypothetical protein